MCLNKRVLIGLGIAAVAVLAVAPRAFGAAGPLLLLAVCPLSMVVMMRSMNGHRSSGTSADGQPEQPERAKAGDDVGPSASAAQLAADHEAQLRTLGEELTRVKAELELRDQRSVS